MSSLRPSAKVGIVVLGFILAAAMAWCGVELRDRFSHVPAAEKAGGMYAFGDLLLAVAIFGVVALVPIGLALYWLKPVEKFWIGLARVALVWAVTGLVAIAINHSAVPPLGWWTLLANLRFGIMPLAALGLMTAALFAPGVRQRWWLIVAGLCDGLAFATVVIIALVLRR